MKQLDPRHEVTVWERNAPDDTFGFGVVFSDETLGGIESADTVDLRAMESQFARWTDIDVDFDGHAVHRRRAGLRGDEPQGAAADPPGAGRRARRHRALPHRGARRRRAARDARPRASPPTASTPRSATRYADAFGPTLDRAAQQVHLVRHRPGLRGVPVLRQADASGAPCRSTATPTPTTGSTFIVEMHEDVWRRAGLDGPRTQAFPPGVSDEYAVERIAEIFADELQRPPDPHQQLQVAQLPHRPQRALARRQRGPARRRRAHRALLHRLGHQAGHGGRARAGRLPARAPDASTRRSTAYQTERKPVVESTQRAAQASLEWFENIGMYADQDPAQFVFNLLTRSRRITFENLKDRDRGVRRADGGRVRPPPGRSTERRARRCSSRSRIGPLELKNRVILSPMDMYSADRRRARRVPPGPPRLQGPRRRRPGDDRDGLRLARGPDHARAARACGTTSSATPGRGSPTSCTSSTHRARSACSSATPAARARPS